MRVRRYLLIAVLLAVAACGSDEASGDVAARLAASTTTALPSTTTTERPAAIAPLTAPEETAVSTTSTTTTTAAPLPTFAPGNAGSRGPVGCRGDCPSVGLQDLDGQENVVLENLTISNPEGRCLTIRGARNITIRNVTVSECGTQSAVWDGYDTGLILIEDSSGITIESSIITRMAAEDHGGARNNAIHVIDSTDVQIINNEISDVFSDIERKAEDQGNRAISVQGSSSGLTIEQNTFRNAGRNALQLARARDLEGVSFSDNLVEGRGPWDSDYEDMISLYSASGTPDDPIVINRPRWRPGRRAAVISPGGSQT